jgi:hypothetical protein
MVIFFQTSPTATSLSIEHQKQVRRWCSRVDLHGLGAWRHSHATDRALGTIGLGSRTLRPPDIIGAASSELRFNASKARQLRSFLKALTP